MYSEEGPQVQNSLERQTQEHSGTRPHKTETQIFSLSLTLSV